MKQSFYAVGIAMLFVTGQSVAQKSETAFLTTTSISNNPFLIPRDEVKTKTYSLVAEERFRKDFKNVKDAEWVEKAGGYRVYFMDGSILTAVDYTKKGSLYSVIKYGKDLLTRDLRSVLNNEFSDFEVKEVSEVKIANFSTRAYVIVLDDKRSLKTVQVIDGEVEVLNEMIK